MIKKPNLYAQINDLQRTITKQFINDYGNLLRWRKDGLDALIDIGSGTGDVLMDFVYPLMPKNYDILVFSDLAENMVNHAKKHYETIERTDFKVLDIESDKVPQELCERFDHVTSFFCLHWVQQQRKALKNIHTMLRPDTGDFLALIMVSFFTYDCCKYLIEDAKWSKYMSDYKNYISPLYHCEDRAAKYREELVEVGFVDCQVENREVDYTFQSRLHLFNFLKSVGVYFEKIPKEEHEAFFEAIVNIARHKKLCRFIEDGGDYKIVTTVKYIMAFARKPETQ